MFCFVLLVFVQSCSVDKPANPFLLPPLPTPSPTAAVSTTAAPTEGQQESRLLIECSLPICYSSIAQCPMLPCCKCVCVAEANAWATTRTGAATTGAASITCRAGTTTLSVTSMALRPTVAPRAVSSSRKPWPPPPPPRPRPPMLPYPRPPNRRSRWSASTTRPGPRPTVPALPHLVKQLNIKYLSFLRRRFLQQLHYWQRQSRILRAGVTFLL